MADGAGCNHGRARKAHGGIEANVFVAGGRRSKNRKEELTHKRDAEAPEGAEGAEGRREGVTPVNPWERGRITKWWEIFGATDVLGVRVDCIKAEAFAFRTSKKGP